MLRFNSIESFISANRTYEYPVKLFTMEDFLTHLDFFMNKQVELDLLTLIQIYEKKTCRTQALNSLSFEPIQQQDEQDGKVKKIFQIKTPLHLTEATESINILFIEDSSDYKRFLEKSHLKLKKNFVFVSQLINFKSELQIRRFLDLFIRAKAFYFHGRVKSKPNSKQANLKTSKWKSADKKDQNEINMLLMLNTRNEYVRAEFIKGFNYLIDSFKSNHNATFEIELSNILNEYVKQQMGICKWEASAFDIDFGSKVKFTSQSEKSEMQRSKKSSKARFHLNHFMLNSENQTIKEQPKSDSNTFYSIFNHLRSVFSTNKNQDNQESKSDKCLEFCLDKNLPYLLCFPNENGSNFVYKSYNDHLFFKICADLKQMSHLDFSRLKQEIKREKELQEVLDATSRESNIEPREMSSHKDSSARNSTSAYVSSSSLNLNEQQESSTNWNENVVKEKEDKAEEALKPWVKSSPQRRVRIYLNKNTPSNTFNIYSTKTRRINNKIAYLSESSCQSRPLVAKFKQAKKRTCQLGSLNLLSTSLCQLESMGNEILVCGQEDSSREEDHIQMRTDHSSFYYKSNLKFKSDSNRNVNFDEEDVKIDRHPALIWTQRRCKFKSRSIDFLDDRQSQKSMQFTLKRNKRHSTNDLMSFEDIPDELNNLVPSNQKWSQAKVPGERRKGLYKPNENAPINKKKKEYRTSMNRCFSPPPPTGFISPYGLLPPPPPPPPLTISNLNTQSASSFSQWKSVTKQTA